MLRLPTLYHIQTQRRSCTFHLHLKRLDSARVMLLARHFSQLTLAQRWIRDEQLRCDLAWLARRSAWERHSSHACTYSVSSGSGSSEQPFSLEANITQGVHPFRRVLCGQTDFPHHWLQFPAMYLPKLIRLLLSAALEPQIGSRTYTASLYIRHYTPANLGQRRLKENCCHRKYTPRSSSLHSTGSGAQ